MADTLQTVIINAQRRLPDLSLTRAIDLANKVNAELYLSFPKLQLTNTSISLTSGTKEYSLGATTTQILSAIYQTSASISTVLLPTTLEFLDSYQQNWRLAGTGVPVQYYFTSDSAGNPYIGFDITPGTTTSGSYPAVSLFVSQRPATFTSSGTYTTDTVPAEFYSSQIYEDGICYFASKELRPSATASYKADYEDQIAKEGKYLETFMEVMHGSIIPNTRG